MLRLRNCRLISALTEGYESDRGDVYIEGKRIAFIKPVDEGVIPAKETIECEGKTLLPGFFELHCHLYASMFDSYRLQLLSDGEVMFGAYDYAKSYLKAGYTTVRDCGSTRNAVVEIKRAIEKGIIEGPRLFASGLIVTPTETGNESYKDLYVEADGPEAVTKACRQELQKGNDFIKIMVSGAFLNEGGDPGQQIMTFEEIKAAVDVATMKNTYVCAHCHGAESIKVAIKAGVKTIEHGTFIDDEGIEMLKEMRNVYHVPTGAIGLYSLEDTTDLSEGNLQKAQQYFEEERANINKAYKAGLLMGFGSDIDLQGFLSHPGYEFIARKTFYYFENIDILKQATINSAIILGLEKELGTIKVGKLADLVLVDGNPDEDIYVMEKPVLRVFKEGKAVK